MRVEADRLKPPPARPRIERSLSRALLWTLGGAGVSLPLLVVPQPQQDQLLAYAMAHLSGLVVVGLAVIGISSV